MKQIKLFTAMLFMLFSFGSINAQMIISPGTGSRATVTSGQSQTFSVSRSFFSNVRYVWKIQDVGTAAGTFSNGSTTLVLPSANSIAKVNWSNNCDAIRAATIQVFAMPNNPSTPTSPEGYVDSSIPTLPFNVICYDLCTPELVNRFNNRKIDLQSAINNCQYDLAGFHVSEIRGLIQLLEDNGCTDYCNPIQETNNKLPDTQNDLCSGLVTRFNNRKIDLQSAINNCQYDLAGFHVSEIRGLIQLLEDNGCTDYCN